MRIAKRIYPLADIKVSISSKICKKTPLLNFGKRLEMKIFQGLLIISILQGENFMHFHTLQNFYILTLSKKIIATCVEEY